MANKRASRRFFLKSGLASGGAVSLAPQFAAQSAGAAETPPPYTLSINIEIMFPGSMPKPERVQRVADQGFKAYSFWSASEADQDAMLKIQQANGMKCASISGTGAAGSSTGLTKAGAEQAYFDEVRARARIARKMGGAQPIIFVGRVQPDVPWETQRAQIVKGLKTAGDIAKEENVMLVMEPLSTGPNQVRMALDTAAVAFPAIEEVSHPNVKVCFDMYHLQLMEGNIVTHLRQGLQRGLIGLVQIGEVPGRREPGTGEIDYAFVMRVLREMKWSGYVDTEMGTSSTPEAAMLLTRKMSMEN